MPQRPYKNICNYKSRKLNEYINLNILRVLTLFFLITHKKRGFTEGEEENVNFSKSKISCMYLFVDTARNNSVSGRDLINLGP